MGDIQRKDEYIKSSVSATLPISLNQQKEIFGIACSGNIKKMCSLMILQNKSIDDLMLVDKESGNNVFHRICTFDHLQLLIFLELMLSRKEFIKHVFLSNNQDNKPIENAVRFSNSLVVKHLFDKKEIQDQYQDNDPMKFRLCLKLFVNVSNP